MGPRVLSCLSLHRTFSRWRHDMDTLSAPVNLCTTAQICGDVFFSLLSWTSSWTSSRQAGDWRHHGGVKWQYCVTRNLFIPHGIIHNIIIRNISIHLHSYKLDEFYGLIFTACVKNWIIIDEHHAPTTSQTHNNYVFIMLCAGWVDIIKIGKDTDVLGLLPDKQSYKADSYQGACEVCVLWIIA